MFEPPSTFTICRGGSEQSDVVTGRPVYFQVTPTAGSSMFDFRVHGQGNAWTHTGLPAWHEQALALVDLGAERSVSAGSWPVLLAK